MKTLTTIMYYDDTPINFAKGRDVMVNATDMAKPFGKVPKDWLRTQQSKDFINSLAAVRQMCPTDLLKMKQGGNDRTAQGTWMHEDVALEFARWLSPEFAIWCNDRIKELLTMGMTATPPTLEQMINDPRTGDRSCNETEEAEGGERPTHQQDRGGRAEGAILKGGGVVEALVPRFRARQNPQAERCGDWAEQAVRVAALQRLPVPERGAEEPANAEVDGDGAVRD